MTTVMDASVSQILPAWSVSSAPVTAPRYRGVLSCDLCRQRNSCKIRDVLCIYTSGTQSKSVQKERKPVNDSLERIRRLEELVLSLASGTKSPGSTSGIATTGLTTGNNVRRTNLLPTAATSDDLVKLHEPPKNLGRFRVDGEQTVYISATHWATIQEEVRSIRESLGDTVPDLAGQAVTDNTFKGPLLLRGISKPLDIDTVFVSMPSKPLVDLLVSRFFTSSQPSIVLLHTTDFQRQYTRFWNNPYDINLSWLSILFGIMAISMHLSQQAGDSAPEALGPTVQAISTFHLKATECLLLANYLKPTTYTIEALLINIQLEFLRSIDLDDSLWVMAATIVRLAMKAGYHRDSAAHTQISPYRGEMRRRAWALLVQLDILVSNQFGLPRMLVNDQFDTLPPHNLLDEDFDEECKELPPSRPYTTYTPIAFTIAKGRILEVLAEIVNRSISVRSSTYEEAMRLDAELNRAFVEIPPPLKLTSEPAISVPQPVLIRRYLLELLYQKARLLLHRGHMEKAQEDLKHSRSRAICVDAAMKLLEHQATIHKQVSQGGLLHRDKWFLWSLEQNDFVLAAMIISLELSFILKHQNSYKPPTDELGRIVYDQKVMIQALRVSRTVWVETQGQSKVAAQAAETLSNVLRKIVSQSSVPAADLGRDSIKATSSCTSQLENDYSFVQEDDNLAGLFDLVDWEGIPEVFD